MDKVTHDSLIGVRSRLKNIVDEIIVIDLPKDSTNKEKSRILKTNMRNYVNGDFLFIDSGTIILSDLSEIDNVTDNISVVYERNRIVSEDFGRAIYEEALMRFDCKLYDSDEYFNSGVMLVKDKLETRQFLANGILSG